MKTAKQTQSLKKLSKIIPECEKVNAIWIVGSDEENIGRIFRRKKYQNILARNQFNLIPHVDVL